MRAAGLPLMSRCVVVVVAAAAAAAAAVSAATAIATALFYSTPVRQARVDTRQTGAACRRPERPTHRPPCRRLSCLAAGDGLPRVTLV